MVVASAASTGGHGKRGASSSSVSKPKSSNRSMSKGFKAGAIGACSSSVGHFLTQPLDVIKTRLIESTFRSSAPVSIKGIAHKVVHQEAGGRFSALWRGASVAVVRVAAGASVYFGSQHTALSYLHRRNSSLVDATSGNVGNDQSVVQHLSASTTAAVGSACRTLSIIACCPITIVKVRREGYAPRPGVSQPSLWGSIRNLARTEGLRGMYTGVVPSILRDVPFAGIYLVLYTRLKSMLADATPPQISRDSFMVSAIAGATGSAIATSITHPFEVIKTRAQLAGSRDSASSVRISAVVRDIWSRVGIMGFSRGLLPRVTKRGISYAISWSLYEKVAAKFLSGGSGL